MDLEINIILMGLFLRWHIWFLETLIPLLLLTLATHSTLLDLVERLMDPIIVAVNTQSGATTNDLLGLVVHTRIQVTNSTATTLLLLYEPYGMGRSKFLSIYCWRCYDVRVISWIVAILEHLLMQQL